VTGASVVSVDYPSFPPFTSGSSGSQEIIDFFLIGNGCWSLDFFVSDIKLQAIYRVIHTSNYDGHISITLDIQITGSNN
jgi:hypothetical protein